jgi:hypothetical protein
MLSLLVAGLISAYTYAKSSPQKPQDDNSEEATRQKQKKNPTDFIIEPLKAIPEKDWCNEFREPQICGHAIKKWHFGLDNTFLQGMA